MKKFVIIAVLLGILGSGIASATDDLQLQQVTAAQTNADTTSVQIPLPPANQTILIKNIGVWYDNGANTNAVYAGIVASTAAHTRQLWLGTTMSNAGFQLVRYENLNFRVDPTTAQAGVRLFISASSSDSIMGFVQYELIPK